MTTSAGRQLKINEVNEAEKPAKELLRKLRYTFVPRVLLAAERDDERAVLLKGRLRNALLRLNPWMTDDQVERAIFKLENVDATSVMEHAIRAQITERLAENPAFYEKLSQRLERIIGEMRQNLLEAAEAVRLLWQLRREALSVADVAAQQGLTEVSFAVYELLERASPQAGNRTGEVESDGRAVHEQPSRYRTGLDERLKAIASDIERILGSGQAIVDWQNKADVQRVMRRDIKRELRKLGDLSEDQLNELAASMVEIARRRVTR